MITVNQLLGNAYSWIDTPVMEGGAVRGVGCNCIGFAAGVAKDSGFHELWKAFEPYQGIAKPDGPMGLLRVLKRYLIVTNEIVPGCLILIRDWDIASHVALVSSPTDIIEAVPPKVTERSMAGRNIVRIYQIPGVIYE